MKRSTVAWAAIIISIIVMVSGILPLVLMNDPPSYVIWGPMVIGLLIMGIGLIASMRDVDVKVNDTYVEIMGPMIDISIPYAMISSVEYRTNFKVGIKMGGYGGTSRVGGGYSNKEFPRYKVAGYQTNPVFVIIHHDEGVTAFNLKTGDETQRKYSELLDAMKDIPRSAPLSTQMGMEQISAEKRSTKVMGLMVLASILVPVLSMLYFVLWSDMQPVESMVFVMLIGVFSPMAFFGGYLLWEKKRKIATDNMMVMVGAVIVLTSILGVAMPLTMLAIPSTIDVTFSDDDMNVDAPFLNDTISYDNISYVELKDDMSYGSRTKGYGGGKMLSGDFKNDDYGNYRLAVFKKISPSIVIHHDGGVLVINQSSVDDTQKVFERLTGKL